MYDHLPYTLHPLLRSLTLRGTRVPTSPLERPSRCSFGPKATPVASPCGPGHLGGLRVRPQKGGSSLCPPRDWLQERYVEVEEEVRPRSFALGLILYTPWVLGLGFRFRNPRSFGCISVPVRKSLTRLPLFKMDPLSFYCPLLKRTFNYWSPLKGTSKTPNLHKTVILAVRHAGTAFR